MAKTTQNKAPQPVATTARAAKDDFTFRPASSGTYGPWSVYGFRLQAIIVALLAFVIYCNSFKNEFAHDDGIVIVKNEYVLEGFAGIPSILSKDAYDSYYRQLNTTNQLHGGRYRPLSIVTFAIEQQFMGAVPPENVDSALKKTAAYGTTGDAEKILNEHMHVRHVFNVLWYMACVVALLYFLRYIVFQSQPIMALVAAVLFTVHPIHTEVVANVKSRDEIMSLLFICTTFIMHFKYLEHKKPWVRIVAMLSYLAAFLSKEYAITLVVLLPASMMLFAGASLRKSIMSLLPYFIVFGIYMMMRMQVVTSQSESSDNEVLNNPYLFASPAEKLATEVATTLNYLKLLIFPHPLSADYSYDTIPYKSWGNILVWLSILIHGGMFAGMILCFRRAISGNADASVLGLKLPASVSRHTAAIMSFALAFYVLHLLLVCNIIFDIGATMGERLIFHSSVGFVIILSYLLCTLAARLAPADGGKKALAGIVGVIVILCSIQTIARNADWKNDYTLFTHDIKVVPNSVLVNANVAAAYITQSDFQKDDTAKRKYLWDAVHILNHTLTIHRTFVAGFLNRGIAEFKLGDVDGARLNMDTVRSLYPTYPTLPGMYKLICDYYLKTAWDKYGKNGRYPEAIEVYKKGLSVDSTNMDLWYNMGGAYFTNKQYPEAAYAFGKAIKLQPNNAQAQAGYHAAVTMLNGGQMPQQPAPATQVQPKK